MVNCNYQTGPSCILISLYYYNSLLGRVHYLYPLALIDHNSFNEESPNSEGYNQHVVV